MKGKFSNLVYIDLFAGPGLCIVDDDSREIEGSPLISLSVPHQFTEYHFVEADNRAMGALKERVARSAPQAAVKYYSGDANVLIPEVVRNLPSSSLNVAVIDPTGLDFRFESFRLLIEGRKIDLIYLFPEFMDVKRNLDTYWRQSKSPLDEVLGTSEWRSRVMVRKGILQLPEEEHWEKYGRPIVELFREQLGMLDYVDVKLGSEIVVRNRRNVPLYYLVFASKHELGHKFWDAIQKISSTGQKSLEF
jgi:three-Cys-motif partner protein